MGCRDNDERGKSGKWGALAVVITGTEACACLDIRVPKQSERGRGGEGASQRELWRERQKVTSVKDCHYHPIISDYVNQYRVDLRLSKSSWTCPFSDKYKVGKCE